MTYENWKIKKAELKEKQEEYSQVAEWCNEMGAYAIQEIDDEYCVVKIPEPTKEEIAQARISELKRLLSETDYVAVKIAEGAATKEEYADVIAQRQALRYEINKLQSEETATSEALDDSE